MSTFYAAHISVNLDAMLLCHLRHQNKLHITANHLLIAAVLAAFIVVLYSRDLEISLIL